MQLKPARVPRVRISQFLLSACLVCLAFAPFPGVRASETPSIRVWQTNHGLPDNVVSGLAQAPDGFIWIAAGFQLARFDGVTFEEFPLKAPLADGAVPRVRQVLSAKGGGFHIGTEQGIVLRVQENGVTAAVGNIPSTRVELMCEDAEGTVWATYRAGALYRVRNGVSERLTDRHGFPDPSVPAGCTLGRDARGRIWIIKSDQLSVFRGERFQPVSKVPVGTTRMTAASDGGLWLCIERQFFKFSEEKGLVHYADIPTGRHNIKPSVLLEDRNGRVWIGTSSSGLFRWDGKQVEGIPVTQREVWNLLEDREGNIWAATNGGGLNRIQPRTMEIEGAVTGLPIESVQSVCEDPAGTFWGMTQDGFFVVRTAAGWKPALPEGVTLPGEGTVVAAGLDGAIWIGTRGFKLCRWKDGVLTQWGREHGIVSRNIRVLHVSREGDVWLGGEGPSALQRVRNEKIQSFRAQGEGVWAIAQDAGGSIWAGTRRGELLRVEGDRVVNETSRLLPGIRSAIRCLHPAKAGGLWAGFDGGGVGRVGGETGGTITRNQGLPDDTIYMLISDRGGWLWVGSRRGLFKVREQEMEAVLKGAASRVQVVRGEGDNAYGLPAAFGDPVNPLLSRDGRLWIPLTTALVVVHPDRSRQNFEPPPLQITAVSLDDAVVAAYTAPLPGATASNLAKQPRLTIPAGHRQLEFAFAAPSFSAPENVGIRYRLDGRDDRWTESDRQRRITYTGLPAGNYTFRVSARNSGGDWSEKDATVAFLVAPFFWQTWWFHGLGLLGFTSVVVGAVRYVSFRRLRNRVAALQAESALHKERARIARDIHDDLGSRLTKIVLLSGLVLRDKAAPEKANERVSEVADTARQLIGSLNATVWAVNPRNDTLPHLVDYIGQYAVDFLRTAEIACAVDLPEVTPNLPVSADVRHDLFLSVKEALNNVVRHAQATEVKLQIIASAERLTIVLLDNGRGFEKKEHEPEADGLRNMQQRLQEMGGLFTIEGLKGGGTRVVFTVPFPARRAGTDSPIA